MPATSTLPSKCLPPSHALNHTSTYTRQHGEALDQVGLEPRQLLLVKQREASVSDRALVLLRCFSSLFLFFLIASDYRNKFQIDKEGRDGSYLYPQ